MSQAKKIYYYLIDIACLVYIDLVIMKKEIASDKELTEMEIQDILQKSNPLHRILWVKITDKK